MTFPTIPAWARIAIGVFLAILQAVQIVIPLSGAWHATIAAALLILGTIGIQAFNAESWLATLPREAAAAVTGLLVLLTTLQQTLLSVPSAVHAAIAVLLVLFGTQAVGTQQPAAAPTSPPAKADQPAPRS